jgi:hypothetical protein
MHHSGGTKVHLSRANGTVHSLPKLQQPVRVPQSVAKRFDAINGLVVPAIPAEDIIIIAEEEKEEDKESFIFDSCWIKRESGELHGFASGVRSAIIELDGKLTRLKGCGNYDQGFIVETIRDELKGIRGSSFMHTTLRELYMTRYIQSLLDQSKRGWKLGNRSLGYFKYDNQFNLESFDTDICCSVFETLGDKRLGDDVLFGLELLLEKLFTVDSIEGMVNRIIASADFPKDRLENGRITPTWISVISENGIIEPMVWNTILFDKVLLANIECPNSTDLDLWNYNLDILRDYFAKTPNSQIFPYLYSRFGYECRVFLDILHESNISWGTYQDKMGFHCNAHANNLVLDIQENQLLYPVDFDMAFTRDSYVDLDFQREDSKDKIESRFMDLLSLEKQGFLLTLSGDNQTSSGVKNLANLKTSAHESLRWILRDNLVHSFNTKSQISINVSSPPNEIIKAILEISLLCLD